MMGSFMTASPLFASDEGYFVESAGEREDASE